MTRFPDHSSRPRHEDTSIALLHLIGQLQVVGNFGGYEHLRDAGAASLRLDAIGVLSEARRELSLCTSFLSRTAVPYFEDVRKGAPTYISDNHTFNHPAMLSWINQLSVELKLLHNLPDKAHDITAEQLDRGKALINDLDTCREQLGFER